MNAMILAAGKGTRLQSLTEAMPKPMLPIGGRPVLEYIVRWLGFHGVRKMAINVHFQGDIIQRHFGDGSACGVSITFSPEPELLGTAGGVKKMEPFFDEVFLVAYGDVLSDLDVRALLAFHAAHGPQPHATLVVDPRPDATQCGVVEIGDDERVRGFIEKPPPGQIRSRWVNSGIMVLDRPLLADVPPGQVCDFGRDILPAWLEAGVPLWAWKLPPGHYLIDMGTPSNYERACRDWPQRAARWMGPV